MVYLLWKLGGNMKKRVISAAIMLLICVPLLLKGGLIYQIGVILISMWGLHEFLSLKDDKKEIPAFICFLSYTSLLLLELNNLKTNTYTLAIDYRLLSGIFLVFLIPTILYPNKKVYSIKDAFYFIGAIFFLGIGFSMLLTIRNISLITMVYLILIATITDTFALITGKLIGKHKLIERVSPNKTIEGTLGGMFFGVLISSVYYQLVIDPNVSLWYLITMTSFLSIMGQFGDLCFSAIKRYFNAKDFSNIIPGHGGILDRLDSIIFILLAFTFFVV